MKKWFTLLWFIPGMALSQTYSVEYSFTGLSFHNDSGPGIIYYIELHSTVTGQSSTLYQVAVGENIPANPATNAQSKNVGFRPDQLRIRTGGVVNNTEDIVYIPADGHCFNDIVSISDQNGLVKNVLLNIQPNLTISISPDAGIYPSSCETLTLSSPATYADNVYRWEYSVDGGVIWTPLSGFDGINTFDIGIADLPGSVVNENVQFRMRFCSNQTSNVLITQFIKCSPDLLSLVPSPTSCSYSNNGGFTATFSRALNAGENLLLNLAQNVSVGDPGSILVAAPIITNADMAGSSYNWLNTLAPGTYYLRYQSDNDGSVYDYGPFDITAPSEVTFSAIWTNINCFGENTGSIDITASGGAGNYQYELNGNGSWNNFVSPNEHILTGLSPGDYQLRVRDANGCTEQN